MKVYGEKERPRALIIGFDDEDLVARLGLLFATYRAVPSVEGIRQAEWDAVVTRTLYLAPLQSHLYVIRFGGATLDRPHLTNDAPHPSAQIVWGNWSIAEELRVPLGLPRRVEWAVRADLLPNEQTLDRHAYLSWGHAGGIYRSEGPPQALRRFLETTEPRVLAGSFVRAGGQAEYWALPEHADAEMWTRVARDEWRARDPWRFPVPWDEDAAWLTPEEEDAILRLREVEAEREGLLAKFDQVERDLQAAAEAVRAQAAAGSRRLLTAQSDELVDVVVSVLDSFGLRVERMDPQKKGELLEDLRVTTPDDPAWEAIVEVKGYAGGAKVTDLARFHRFVARYEMEKGRAPSVCWYICNHSLQESPSRREPILAGADDDIRAYQDEFSLVVVSTKDLFRLYKSVARGERNPMEVRTLLVHASGRFAS